ncbi:DUF6644 family protein [Chroococcus sp. FPU101]|uniref:DUF6644 family protein n=1 Tax=Chroococcus sp. FPU101 TaxID=1974212 RepID=UPI001A90903B|nr:DUF6644 family protein [Chroococcus sp. FPU101]GFE71903.1 hypothetical protein CFPU101_45130 [Chroococcus sp. FPU101]
MEWLESSWLAESVRQSLWLYPLLEILHILSFSILFGAVFLFDLRLLGFSRRLPITALAKHLFPWVYLSFGGTILTGFCLFIVDATAIAANLAFRLKLLLILLAAINAAVYQKSVSKSSQKWNVGVSSPTKVKAIALISLILWTAVIGSGRLIAYL